MPWCRFSRAQNILQIHPCWVDSLTDPKKYPMCFRNAPTNQQIGGASNRYVVDVLKKKKVAVISDTTGYGTASLNAYVPMLKEMEADVVYQNSVDAANPDLKPEILRMQSAGAEAIMPWSVNAGFLSRIINTRGQMDWEVPICGQTTLGSGQTKACSKSPNTGRRSTRTTSLRSVTTRTASFPIAHAPSSTLLRSKIDMATRCCGGSASATTRRT